MATHRTEDYRALLAALQRLEGALRTAMADAHRFERDRPAAPGHKAPDPPGSDR